MEIGHKYTARVMGLHGAVFVEGDEKKVQVRYKRYSKLGEALLKNLRQERAVLANYIRQKFGLPRGVDATYFEFVGV